jgi:hypothetical protein
LPNDIQIDIIIGVNHAVAHAGDFDPRNLMRSCCIFDLRRGEDLLAEIFA